jgi:hypothetical protein
MSLGQPVRRESSTVVVLVGNVGAPAWLTRADDSSVVTRVVETPWTGAVIQQFADAVPVGGRHSELVSGFFRRLEVLEDGAPVTEAGSTAGRSSVASAYW